MTTPTITCACCGATVTDRLCCPTPQDAPWGTKCSTEHEETP